MIFGETLLFLIVLVNCIAILFLFVYYVITLSDLECDYLNAQECCDKLNYWILPKFIAHAFFLLILSVNGYFVLALCNLPMCLWLTRQYYSIPRGNIGVYDPAEIYNRGQLKKHINDCILNVVYYLVFFFIYLYSLILAILKGDPVIQQSDDEIVTHL